MLAASDLQPYIPTPNTPAERLMKARDRILEQWVERVKRSVAPREQVPIIVNTLPALLENLAQALDANYPREFATEGTTIATEHGGERARVTRYSPGDVIREFQLLRETVFELLSEEATLTAHESAVVFKSIDQAMGESLTAYLLVHEGIREQFTMTLTHDLRNPLSAIQSTADLIHRYYHYPEKRDRIPHLAGRIGENVRRVDRMIQDLLDASRIRSGEKVHFHVQEYELSALIEEVIAQMASIHGDRFAFRGNPLRGHWNADAFRRAIENLIANAIKYGDPHRPITLELEAAHGRAIVSVHNEGAPIPVEEQESLFRSFMRSKAAQAGEKAGWGLGLAMVRGMAEGHGGSVTVDSGPGRGTTFLIDVPIDSRPHLAHPTTPGA